MTGQAAPATQTILDELNSLTPENTNELQIRRFRKEAERLLETDAHAAYVLMGAIAAFDFDIQRMRDNHLNSIRLARNDGLTHLNYATSLERTGFFSEASEYARRAYELDHSEDSLKSYAFNCYQAARFAEAHGALEELFAKMHVEEEQKNNQYWIKNVISGLAAAKNCGVTDDQTSFFQDIATSVLRENSNYWIGVSMINLVAGRASQINLFFHVNQPVDSIINLNEQLATTLAHEDIDPLLNDLISVTYTSRAQHHASSTMRTTSISSGVN